MYKAYTHFLIRLLGLCLVVLSHPFVVEGNAHPTFSTSHSNPERAGLPVQNCISVVGDSIPEGRMVFRVPGHGFPVLKTPSLAEVLTEHLASRGIVNLPVYDRSVGAANLSIHGKNPYFLTDTFRALLRDHCRFFVMFGWNNDLNVVQENGAEDYVRDVANLVRFIHLITPDTHVLILTHYWGQPQDFVEGYGVGVTFENFTAHVQAVLNACQPGGILARQQPLTCLETQPLFDGMDTSFVVLGCTRDEVLAMISEPVPADVQPMFDVYWRENPTALIDGDGVHLSPSGKAVVAEAILDNLWSLIITNTP